MLGAYVCPKYSIYVNVVTVRIYHSTSCVYSYCRLTELSRPCPIASALRLMAIPTFICRLKIYCLAAQPVDMGKHNSVYYWFVFGWPANVVCTIRSYWHSVCYVKFHRCNGGFPQSAWDYYFGQGIVSGGNYGSKEVSLCDKWLFKCVVLNVFAGINS